jgi:hypothetical protein
MSQAERQYAQSTRALYLRTRHALLQVLESGTEDYPIIAESDDALDDGLRYTEQIYAILVQRQLALDMQAIK